MKTHPASLENGTMPTTITHLHSHLVGSGIPSGNSAFSRSIYDFTRVLLGAQTAKSDLPPSPPTSQLATWQSRSAEAHSSTATLARFRLYLSKHNLSDLEVAGRLKCIPVICRAYFIEDLATANVNHISFAWLESPGSPYNEWFASMIWKHWTFAKNNGLLRKYAISPTDDTLDNGQKVLYRWLHGRQEELRLESRDPNWRRVKSIRETRSKRSKQLTDHRVDTCVALSLPPSVTRIFMDPRCTSDTEEESAGDLHRMHLPWRSEQLTEFAHKLDNATVERLRKEKGTRSVKKAKLLELRRKDAINTSKRAAVPIGLPRNCYDPVFLQTRPKVAQEVLKVQDIYLDFPLI